MNFITKSSQAGKFRAHVFFSDDTSGSWIMSLCGSPVCFDQAVVTCAWKEIFDSSTCMNHLLVIGIAMLIIIVLALHLLIRVLKRSGSLQQLVTLDSPLHLAVVLFHGCLGLLYLGLALWMLGSSFNQDASLYLPHWWLVNLSQRISLILISFSFSIRAHVLGVTLVRISSVLLTIYAGYICCSSVVYMLADNVITTKACLDVLFLPGSLLLHAYGIWQFKNDGSEGLEDTLYNPLNTETAQDMDDSESHVTPFAKAGVFSLMSFWLLNPLMKMGYEKPLEEKDMPHLGATDQAYNQYLMFLEQLSSMRQPPNGNPSVFWTIISCHKSEIIVSGFFALLNVLTLSSGPLLLKAFINVSLGKGSFRYEGYALASAMFICKCCESLHRGSGISALED
jgi:ATP-binding cassette, subfamily C (CFTR/MRP), member 2